MSESLKSTEHLDDETMSAYIDGRLDADEQASAAEHLTNCDECYTVYTIAAETVASVGLADENGGGAEDVARFSQSRDERPNSRRATLRKIAAAGSILAVAALLIVLSWPSLRAWYIQRRGGFPALVLAAEPLRFRSTDARLSGGFAHKPLRASSRMRGSDDTVESDWRIRRESDRVAKSAKDGNPVDLHTFGVAQLLLGRAEEAVKALDRALQIETDKLTTVDAIQHSTNWRLLVDVSAAYAARGRKRNAPDDFATALEAAEQAWRFAREPEVAWNRAIALRSQNLPDAERQAWRAYLAMDTTSPWAAEARQRLQQLESPTHADRWERVKGALTRKSVEGTEATIPSLVAQFTSQVRSYSAGELLLEWMALEAKRAGAGQTHAERLQAIGSVLEAAHRDALLSEITSTLPSVQRAGITRIQPLMAATATVDQLDTAARLLRHVSPRMADLATLRAIAIEASRRNYRSARKRFVALPQWDCSRLAFLCGKRDWLRGFVALGEGDTSSARRYYLAAAGHYETLQDLPLLARVEARLAEADLALGSLSEATQLLHRAAARSAALGDRGDLGILLHLMSETLTRRGYLRAASAVLHSMVDEADRQKRPDFVAVSYLSRAVSNHRLRDASAALRDLETAERAANRVLDPGVRQRHLADLYLARAVVLEKSDFQAALASIDTALTAVEESGHGFRRAEIVAQKARILLYGGDWAAAQTNFATALAMIEAERARLPGGRERLLFFEHASSLFDDVIHELVRRDRSHEAFLYAAVARGRNVADVAGVGAETLRDFASRPRLASDAAAVQYWQLDDRLIVFTIAGGTVDARVLPLSRAHVERELRRCRPSFEAWSRGADECAASFYDQLISPIAARIRTARSLWIVSHGALDEVPFVVLLDRAARQRLVERHVVRMAPSVAIMAGAAQPFQCWSALLLVAAPGDAPLEYARADERPLRGLCGDVAVIEGTMTPESFATAISGRTLVQYSGHAEGGTAADEPRLLLEPGTATADLTLTDVEHLHVAATDLVVLAACDTGVGVRRRLAHSASMADGFVRAGAKSVLSTLWPVDDRAANAFIESFYGNLPGRTVADAFAETQRRCLSSPSCLAAGAWAAFQLTSVH